MAIRKSKELSAVLGESELRGLHHLLVSTDLINIEVNGGMGLRSQIYHLSSADLRSSPSEALNHLFANTPDRLLSPSLPTLLLFECVLVYMSPAESSAVIQSFVDYFSQDQGGILGSIVYEMFGLGDAFGRVMLNNLKVRII